MAGRPAKVLVAGWLSYEDGHATAGDLLACELVCEWLGEAGYPYEVAVAPPFSEGVDWRGVDPTAYSHVVFVGGPFGRGPLEAEFLGRFADNTVIGVDLSMLAPLERWDPFDRLIERDSSARARPDIVFLSRKPLVPVVGICLVEPYEGARVAEANAAIRGLIMARDAAVVEIDTRLDENATGLRSAAEVESLIARVDALVTTRLYGMVLALKNGVPPIAIDPEVGGAKIVRQAETLGWPLAYSIDKIETSALRGALDYALTAEARGLAAACAARAADRAGEASREFLAALADPSIGGRKRAVRAAMASEPASRPIG
jgi:hypothetical protein